MYFICTSPEDDIFFETNSVFSEVTKFAYNKVVVFNWFCDFNV